MFNRISEIIGWLQIAISPTLIGLGIGVFIYFSAPSDTTLVLGILILCLGFLVGAIWATKIWKSKGTVWFMSRTGATQEPDEPEDTSRP